MSTLPPPALNSQIDASRGAGSFIIPRGGGPGDLPGKALVSLRQEMRGAERPPEPTATSGPSAAAPTARRGHRSPPSLPMSASAQACPFPARKGVPPFDSLEI